MTTMYSLLISRASQMLVIYEAAARGGFSINSKGVFLKSACHSGGRALHHRLDVSAAP